MKLKPILIPTDKSNLFTHAGDLHYSKECKESDLGKNYDIILIDTEAEIVKGDLVHVKGHVRLINTVKHVDDLVHFTYILDQPKKDCAKIISSTNKSHNLPLLSPQSIQLLINYYNEHGCMPAMDFM